MPARPRVKIKTPEAMGRGLVEARLNQVGFYLKGGSRLWGLTPQPLPACFPGRAPMGQDQGW